MSTDKMLFKKMTNKKIRILTISNIIILLLNWFTYRKFTYVIGVLCVTLIANIYVCIFFNEKNRKNR